MHRDRRLSPTREFFDGLRHSKTALPHRNPYQTLEAESQVAGK
jgi:hypothetical protein